MGTNYYFHKTPPCPHCGRQDEPVHLGKSSAGWCFGLHVYPDDGINTLEDWKKRLPAGEIRDEYNGPCTVDQFCSIVEKRGPYPILPTTDWLEENSAECGPGNMARHRVDGHHCIGHGEGTWDYCVGNFS